MGGSSFVPGTSLWVALRSGGGVYVLTQTQYSLPGYITREVKGGAPLGVILTGAAEKEGASSVKMGCSRRRYLQCGESSLPERPSPAQRRLRRSGCLGCLHLLGRPGNQFPHFLH